MARLGNPNSTSNSYGSITGLITQDELGRATARFGGITWTAPGSWSGKAYGQSVETKWNPNWDNSSLFTQFLPMIYGTCMVYPVTTNISGNANQTTGEAVVSIGPVQNIYSVNINDHDIQGTNSISQMSASFPVNDKLRRYRIISSGDRSGNVTVDPAFSMGHGDPHGGQCCIFWSAYSNEAPSSSPPTIRCVVFGNPVPAIQPFDSITDGVVTVANNTLFGEGVYVTVFGTGTSIDGTAYQTSGNTNTSFQLVGCTATTGAGYFAGAVNDPAQNLGATSSGITEGDVVPIPINGQACNPVWAILDVLVKGGIGYADLDINSWIAAAAVCDRQIDYTKNDGTTGTHALYSTSLYLKEPQSIADIVRGIRLSCKAILRPSASGANGGLLGIVIEQTLADQQPTPDSNSNYQTAVENIDHTGALASGYVKYSFDESNILRVNDKSSLEITQQPINSSYNTVSFGFQDSENSFVSDNVTVTDASDINRIGQQVSYSLPVLGINSYDHAKRIGAWFIAKGLQGNPRGDSSGTWTAKFETTARAHHLQIGDLILLSSTRDGISNQVFRVSSITPSQDWETMTIEAAFHLDQWYVDGFGQADFQLLPTVTNSLRRPPLPWIPGKDAPVNSQDPFGKDYRFDISQVYGPADQNGVISPEVIINGAVPTAATSTQCVPPLFDLMASTSSTGGTIHSGNAYSIGVCTNGTDGLWSSPSSIVNVGLPSGTGNTYTISLTNVDWRALSVAGATVAPVAYGVFMGPDNNHMTLQGTYTDFPSTLTITSYTPGTVALPDPQFDHFRAKLYIGRHTGCWGGQVSAVSTTTIAGAGATWTAGALVGRVASFVAINNGNSVPVRNYTITANTTTTLTVAGNPQSDGVAVGDVFVVRLGVSGATTNSITDSAWNGCGQAMTTNAEAGRTLRIIEGTGKGQTWPIASNTADTVTINGVFNPQPDSTSVWIVQEANTFDMADSASMPITLDVPNEAGSTIVIEVASVAANGQESVPQLNPVRDLYIWGTQGLREITSASTQLASDGRVFCISTGGPYTFQLLPRANVTNQTLLVQKISTDTNAITVQLDSGDVTNGITFTDGTTNHQLVNQNDYMELTF